MHRAARGRVALAILGSIADDLVALWNIPTTSGARARSSAWRGDDVPLASRCAHGCAPGEGAERFRGREPSELLEAVRGQDLKKKMAKLEKQSLALKVRVATVIVAHAGARSLDTLLQAEEEAREAPESKLQRELRSMQQRMADLEAENVLLADKLLDAQASPMLVVGASASAR